MFTKRFLVSLAATIATAAAQYKGFNYASTNADGSTAYQSDFEQQFNVAKGLVGAPGFTSARLYTMIQDGTTNTPIEAIPAAISTGTTLLLGLWASAGQAHITNEIQALTAALSQYPGMSKLIAGISVGSEDLYRETPIGIASGEGPGATPSTLSSYISQVRAALRQAGMSHLQVGHVDTWTAWVNGSNAEVISNVDFLGLDSYPYYEKTDSNDISNGGKLFDQSYEATLHVAQGKQVWITETGWALSGPTTGQAVASVQNAKKYWDQVACKYVGKINTWWFTLYDQGTSPAFGIVGSTLSSNPAFDLHCPKHAGGAPKHSSHPSHSSHSSHPATHHKSTMKTHHHAASKTSAHSHPTHTSMHHKQHHQHKPSHTATHHTQKHTSASKPAPTSDTKAKANSDPSNNAGVMQPSLLLMVTMLAFWCL